MITNNRFILGVFVVLLHFSCNKHAELSGQTPADLQSDFHVFAAINGKPVDSVILNPDEESQSIQLVSSNPRVKIQVKEVSVIGEGFENIKTSHQNSQLHLSGRFTSDSYGTANITFTSELCSNEQHTACEELQDNYQNFLDLRVYLRIDTTRSGSALSLTDKTVVGFAIGLMVSSFVSTFGQRNQSLRWNQYLNSNPGYFSNYYSNPTGQNYSYTGGAGLGYGFNPGQNNSIIGNQFSYPWNSSNGYPYTSSMNSSYSQYGRGFGGVDWGQSGFRLIDIDGQVNQSQECSNVTDKTKYSPHREIGEIYQRLPKRIRKAFSGVNSIELVSSPEKECASTGGSVSCYVFRTDNNGVLIPRVILATDRNVIHSALTFTVLSAVIEHQMFGIGGASASQSGKEIFQVATEFAQYVESEIERKHPVLHKGIKEMLTMKKYDNKRKTAFYLASFGKDYYCSNASRESISRLLPDSASSYHANLGQLLDD